MLGVLGQHCAACVIEIVQQLVRELKRPQATGGICRIDVMVSLVAELLSEGIKLGRDLCAWWERTSWHHGLIDHNIEIDCPPRVVVATDQTIPDVRVEARKSRKNQYRPFAATA